MARCPQQNTDRCISVFVSKPQCLIPDLHGIVVVKVVAVRVAEGSRDISEVFDG